MGHYLSMGRNSSMGHYYIIASTETVALFVCMPSHYRKKTNKLCNLIYSLVVMCPGCFYFHSSCVPGLLHTLNLLVSQWFFLGVYFISKIHIDRHTCI